MSEIIENAITSIKLGIEDFQTGDDDRMLSAARNYYAGLLLLAKECLVNTVPDTHHSECAYSQCWVSQASDFLRGGFLTQAIHPLTTSAAMPKSKMSNPVPEDSSMLAREENPTTEYISWSAHEASSRKSLPQ